MLFELSNVLKTKLQKQFLTTVTVQTRQFHFLKSTVSFSLYLLINSYYLVNTFKSKINIKTLFHNKNLVILNSVSMNIRDNRVPDNSWFSTIDNHHLIVPMQFIPEEIAALQLPKINVWLATKLNRNRF